MDGKIDLKRIAEIISKQSPDLIALQEVDKNCKRSGNRDIAAELGKLLKMEYRFGKFMDFQGGQYGMAVLSRLPVIETKRHELPQGAEPRCALEVQVEAKELKSLLSFVCIHNDWTKESIRVKQIRALLEAFKGRTGPVILAGDFNAPRKDESMKLLEKEGWRILEKKRGKKHVSFEQT